MFIDSSLATYHSIIRTKDRMNEKNIRSAEKNISLARSRGKTARDYTSWEREYLIHETRDDCLPVAYRGHCYIFNAADVCVTMYPLPAWFGKKKQFSGKERIRDMKKYQRYCVDESRMDYER